MSNVIPLTAKKPVADDDRARNQERQMMAEEIGTQLACWRAATAALCRYDQHLAEFERALTERTDPPPRLADLVAARKRLQDGIADCRTTIEALERRLDEYLRLHGA
jgi:hypothetical protein